MDRLKNRVDGYATKLNGSSFMAKLMENDYARHRLIYGTTGLELFMFFLFLGLGHAIFANNPYIDLIAVFGVYCGFVLVFLIVFFVFAVLMIRGLKTDGGSSHMRRAVYTQLICVCVFAVIMAMMTIAYMGTLLLCKTELYKFSSTCTVDYLHAIGTIEIMICLTFLFYTISMIVTEKKICKADCMEDPIVAETAQLLYNEDDSHSVFSER